MYSREQRWGGTATSVTCPHPWLVFVDYCYTLIAVGLHHRCPDVSFCCSLILLLIISPRVCYASSLCLSNTHKHPLLQDHDPLFLPFTRNIQLCLFSKAQFPNKVKLQLQRLWPQLFHTQYGSPASSHVVHEYCLQGTRRLGMVLLMLESHLESFVTTSAELFLDALLCLGYLKWQFLHAKDASI